MIDIGHSRVTMAKFPIFDKIQDGIGRYLEFEFLGISRVVNGIFASNLVCGQILAIQKLLLLNIPLL